MQYDNARHFLYRVMPWAPVGDPTAFVNVHWTFQGAGYNKAAWSGRACMSIEEVIKHVSWASKQADTRDFYICLFTQRECEEVPTKNGSLMRKALREQANSVQTRALWIDADVKFTDAEGVVHHADGYANTVEAMKALVAFIKAAGLPRPTFVIETGTGGIHAYWTMDEALDTAKWQPLANALANAARRHGFKCDTQVTVDSARVMRLPDTINFKAKKPARFLVTPVPHDYSVDELRQKLAPYMGAEVIELTPRGKTPGLNDELAGGIERKSLPVNLKSAADAGCGFLANAFADNGASYGQPLWNLTTLAATFAEDGRAVAHELSRGHSAYSVEDTDELFDRKLRERTEKDLGWPSCAAVENAGCASCVSCPLKGPGTRPLQFAKVAQPAQQPGNPANDLPDGYTRDKAGYVFKTVVNAKNGTSRIEKVIPYPLMTPWAQEKPAWVLYFDTIRTHDKKPVMCTMPIDATHSSTTYGQALSQNGLHLGDKHRKEFKEFMMSWMQKLQSIKDGVTATSPYGWVDNDQGKTIGFAYGGKLFTTDGNERPSARANQIITDMYSPVGELKPWKQAAKMITMLGTPERDAFLAASFGAPLVHFTNMKGLVISTYSQASGAFKTTAMETALAIWGHPTAAKFGLSDTQNHVFGRIGATNSLPAFWDEIKTREETEKFVSITFQMTSGKEKGRMDSSANVKASGLWDTALISASNESLIDPIKRFTKSTTAGLYRLFEWEVPPTTSKMSNSLAIQVMRRLNTNFGNAGVIYAKFLGHNFKRIEDDVRDQMDAYEKQLGTTKEERYWLASVTVLMLGARYANELGLVEINEARLFEHLTKVLERMRSQMKDQDTDLSNPVALSNLLHQYIGAQKPRHFLVTDKMHIGRGKPPVGYIKVLSDISKLEQPLVHIAETQRRMRISSTAFRSWLRLEGYSVQNVMDMLRDQFGMQQVQGTLGAGTEFRLMEYVLEFDLNHPVLAPLVEVS